MENLDGLLDFSSDFVEWKNYRTIINDKVAIISANVKITEQFEQRVQNKVAQCTFYFDADENGLPLEQNQALIFSHILKLLVQCSALPDVLYAGHILSNGKVEQYFYLQNENEFLETALQLLDKKAIQIQDDPNWDLFTEFLMPSQLEMRFSLTEELLDSIAMNGMDLSQIYNIEHRFHFDDREELEQFIEKFSLSKTNFITIRYSDRKIQLDDMDYAQYLVKIEQEMTLDSQEIFSMVELFDKLLNDYPSGEYLGWESANFADDKIYLN